MIKDIDKKRMIKWIIIGAVALAFVITVIVATVKDRKMVEVAFKTAFETAIQKRPPADTMTQKCLVYRSGKELHYISNYTKEKVKDVTVFNDINLEKDYPFESEVDRDQSHLFFYQSYEYEDESQIGKLYCMPLSGYSEDETENEEQIVKVSDNAYSYEPLSEGKAIYLKKWNQLNYFDGTESHVLRKNVYDFHVEQDTGITYAGENGFYIAKFEDDLKEKKIESSYANVIYLGADIIIYTYYEDSGNESINRLCSCTWDGERKKISDVSSVLHSSNYYEVDSPDVWYCTENVKKMYYGDFVSDRPERPDAQDYIIDEVTYDEACSDIYWRDETYYEDYYSEGTGADIYSHYNDYEDTVYYRIDGDWCTMDSDELWDDISEYNTMESVMDELDSDEYEFRTYDLYHYRDGKSEKVAEDVASECVKDRNVCCYQTVEEPEPVISLYSLVDEEEDNDIDDIEYDIDDAVYNWMLKNGGCYYVIGNGEPRELGETSTIKAVELSVTTDEKTAIVRVKEEDPETEGSYLLELSATEYQIDGDKLKTVENFLKEGQYIIFFDDTMYYYDQLNSSETEGDLYARKDGKSILLEKKEKTYYYYSYVTGENTAVQFISDDNSSKYGLTCYVDGEETLNEKKIIKNSEVNTVLPNNRVLYIKNNRLYYTDGEEINREIAVDASDVVAPGRLMSLGEHKYELEGE